MPFLMIKDTQRGASNKIDLSNLTIDRIRIGKKEGRNELVLAGSNVSREHCEIVKNGNSFLVRDRGSSNGTFLNGKKTQEASLSHNDVITVGEFEITYREEGKPIDAPPRVAPTPAPAPTPTPIASAPKPPPAASSPPPGDDSDSSPDTSGTLKKKKKKSGAPIELKRKIHQMLRQNRTIKLMDFSKVSDDEARGTTKTVVDQILHSLASEIPRNVNLKQMVKEILDEALALGPLEELLADDTVSEIMVNNWDTIYVEQSGKITLSPMKFTDNDQLLQIIRRILAPLGRRVDESSPLVDARLKDGSRVNAIIPPLAVSGPSVTIRKFPKDRLRVESLIGYGTLTEPMAQFLDICVKSRKNIAISGGTGSGKTTLLNIISSFIPHDERIVTIEDVSELRLPQDHVVRLESRPPNLEGKGAIQIQQLVINSLRMRPDRVVVGECRGGEALDMLQAMNTGHDGSLTTLHANSPRDAIARLETMVLMAGMDLPAKAIREQIASAIDIVVQQSRLSDGSRKIMKITEITGMEGQVVTMQDIFSFEQTGYDKDGKVVGYHKATGTIPKFVQDLRKRGIAIDMSIFAT